METMRPFSMSEVIQNSQSMALGTMQAASAAKKIKDQKASSQAGAKAGRGTESYNPDKHIQFLKDAGLYGEADDLRKMRDDEIKSNFDKVDKGFDILTKSAVLVRAHKGAGWENLRDMVKDMGIFGDKEIPEKYDPEFVNKVLIASQLTAKRLNDFKLEASDESLMLKAGAVYLNGNYDPITGVFSGMDKEKEQKVIDTSAAATRIFMNNMGSITRLEAYKMAAGEMREEESKTKTTPNTKEKKDTALSGRNRTESQGGKDPASLRDFLGL